MQKRIENLNGELRNLQEAKDTRDTKLRHQIQRNEELKG
jgi:hypothetical protein